jgi:mannan endo-1,4-beta-mannosidase
MALAPGFVRTRGTKFVLNGQTFPVVGVNCYFLSYCSEAARAETIAAILQTGANVVRSVAFLNHDVLPADGVSFQYGSGGGIVINDGPEGLRRLDALIEAAEQYGLQLILPLVNYWSDLGGMSTYLEWLFPGQTLHVTEFYRRPEARAAYKSWVAHVLNRVNSRTGVAYRDSPAIMAWELANEPRCPVPGGRELLLDWAAEMAQFVKQQDPNHLVSLGDEGFLKRPRPKNHLYKGSYGVDFDAILEIPDIDFGTYRFYPSANAMNVRNDFARVWIADHVAAGARANKPVVLEEYGLVADRDDPDALAERDQWYEQWLDSVYIEGGAGDLLWMMGCTEASVAGNYDGYTIYSAAEVPSVVSHAREMQSRVDSED